MNSSKEEILKRVRNALQDVPEDEAAHQPVDKTYQQKSKLSLKERVNLFADRVSDYEARVSFVNRSKLAKTIGESCERENVQKLVIPPGISEEWLPKRTKKLAILRDEPVSLTHQQLDESDAVLTGCYLAVAQTGTIVINGGAGQGRRALTLLPDFHICVVKPDQIVGIVPEAFAGLEKMVKATGPPVTFISGPSATSDIELSRVEGVHGPRRLEVLIVEDQA